MSKCNEKDVSKRGGANPQNNAYNDTVADYSNPAASGDNVINGLNAPRYTLTLLHNGIVGNNTFFGYSNLLPGDSTPVIIPIFSQFFEFSFSNSNSNADYTLEFRINSTTGTPFYTVSKVNTQFFVDTNVDQNFNQGDEIYVKYIDNGQSASDAAIVLLFKALI